MPSSNSSTVTSKLNVISSVAGTFRFIPDVKLAWLYSFLTSLFTFILFSTNVVPAGILSTIVTFLSKWPAFLTVIV